MEDINLLSAEHLISLFDTPPFKRTAQQLEVIMSYIKNNNFIRKIFTEYNSDKVLWEFCRHLNLKYYPKNRPVFKFGELGDKIYLILKGKISIISEIRASKYFNTRKNIFSEVLDRISNKPQEDWEKLDLTEAETKLVSFIKHCRKKVNLELQNEQLSGGIKEITILKQGDYYEDKSSLTNKPQIESLVAISEACLAVIPYKDLNRILETHSQKPLDERVKYLKNLPIFNKATKSSLKELAQTFIEKMFNKDQIICNNKSPFNILYFVKNGEVKIVHDELVSKPAYISNDITVKLSMMKPIKKEMKVREVIKEKNEIFGYEGLIAARETRPRCVCLSSFCLLYEVKIEELKKFPFYKEFLVFLKNKYTKESLKGSKEAKQNSDFHSDKELNRSVKEILDDMKIVNYFNQGLVLRKASSTTVTSPESNKIQLNGVKNKRYKKEVYKGLKKSQGNPTFSSINSLPLDQNEGKHRIIESQNILIVESVNQSDLKNGTIQGPLKNSESFIISAGQNKNYYKVNESRHSRENNKAISFARRTSVKENSLIFPANEPASNFANFNYKIKSKDNNLDEIGNRPSSNYPTNASSMFTSKFKRGYSMDSFNKKPYVLSKKFIERSLNIKRNKLILKRKNKYLS